MNGDGTRRPGTRAARFLGWLDRPSAAWITLCGVLIALTAYGLTDIFLATDSETDGTGDAGGSPTSK